MVSSRFVVMASTIWPWSSPRVDDKSMLYPSTGPLPDNESNGSAICSGLPVDIVQAWLQLPLCREASLVPTKFVSLSFKYWMSVVPPSGGRVTDPQIWHTACGRSANLFCRVSDFVWLWMGPWVLISDLHRIMM